MVVTDFRVDVEPKEQKETNGEYMRMIEQCGMYELAKELNANEANIPYRQLTREQMYKIKKFFAHKEDIKTYYHDEPPMEALQLIWFAVQTNIFTQIKIFYGSHNPDPMAIGFYKIPEHPVTKIRSKYNIDYADMYAYLIAAWGPEKPEIEELLGSHI